MASMLVVDGLAIERGSRVLATGISFAASEGDVIGLIGPNGCGKSTLLRTIAGEAAPAAGTATVAPRGTVGLLEQGGDWPRGWSIARVVEHRTGIAQAAAELDAATAAMADGPISAADAERYERALQAWLDRGGADLAQRFAKVAEELGLHPETARTAASLSGGESARLSLTCILLSRFDVLLLDEPTNDLDEDGLGWLADFVRGCPAPVVLVTHDRDFLSEVATGIVEFDPALERVMYFAGGYDAWVVERARAIGAATQDFEAYRDQRARLLQQAERARAQSRVGEKEARRKFAKGRVDKLQRDKMVEGATGGGQVARRLQQAADRLAAREQPRKQWQLRLAFPAENQGRESLTTLTNARWHRSGFTLGPVTTAIYAGDRILLSGSNGSGKSTLLELVTGGLEPSRGRVSRVPPDLVGIVNQRRSLRTAATTLDAVLAADPGLDEESARTLLAKFEVGPEDLAADPGDLSWGERTRIQLAMISVRPTCLIVFDEPTNHLDLAAVEQVEAALACYAGAILLVTHDQRLRRRFRATRHWQMTNGMLTESS